MSHTTMTVTRMAVASGTALLMMMALPAAQAVAGRDGRVNVRTCLAPLGDVQRSPDVLQGWIDGCRREQAAREAVSLGNYL
jgi:hypothetical protein